MSTSDSMRYISRIDSSSTHGYYVRAGLQQGIRAKLFSDRTYGGKAAALRAAKQHRDEILEQLGTRAPSGVVAGRMKNKRTRSGVTGVHLLRGRLDGELYWRVKVSGKVDRTFSVKKYGYAKAFELAVFEKYEAIDEPPPKIKPPPLRTLLTRTSHD